MGVVEFLQNEPELWQRGAIVGVAALTGFISGYRSKLTVLTLIYIKMGKSEFSWKIVLTVFISIGSALIRLRNTLFFSGVATTVCWPKETVAITSKGLNQAKRPFAAMWAEYCKY